MAALRNHTHRCFYELLYESLRLNWVPFVAEALVFCHLVRGVLHIFDHSLHNFFGAPLILQVRNWLDDLAHRLHQAWVAPVGAPITPPAAATAATIVATRPAFSTEFTFHAGNHRF